MSEIPAPEEVISEATKPDSPESSTPESGKNYDIKKLFDNFRSSPEYEKGLIERNKKLKPGTMIPELLKVRGYEGFGAPTREDLERTIGEYQVDTREFKKASEEYKGAFMAYVGRFSRQHDQWPLYFSPEKYDTETAEAYERYKKAADFYNKVTGSIPVDTDADVDLQRSRAHDELAMLLYKTGKVKSYAQGALAGRVWLVADGIDSRDAIASMDKARDMRDNEKRKNIEIMGSR